jgi:DNA-binding response OmpR family regulator
MNAAAKRLRSGEKRRLNVLIADDSRDTVETLAAILSDEGHVVQTVVDAKRILDAVARYEPDVCILDLKMPDASGYAVGREIVEKYGDQRPWLIAVSGTWFGQTDRLLARSIGFDRFFQKPADPQELLEFLAELPDAPSAA